jgi:hypothetical protein
VRNADCSKLANVDLEINASSPTPKDNWRLLTPQFYQIEILKKKSQSSRPPVYVKMRNSEK